MPLNRRIEARTGEEKNGQQPQEREQQNHKLMI